MLIVAMFGLPGPAGDARAEGEVRTLTIYNIHNKETTTVTFKRDGEYLPDGLKQLNYVFRDWRRDEPTKMDPELFDLIWEIYTDLGSQEPIHLVSGFRSRKTNNRLRRTRGGQAKNSRHILGKAADLHFPDVKLKHLRNSALIRERGGVGWYPRSGLPFVHVDTGRVRHWPRVPRRELAALFPSGRSKHLHGGGRRITKSQLARLGDPRAQMRLAKLARLKAKPTLALASVAPSALPLDLERLKARLLGDRTGATAPSVPRDITAALPLPTVPADRTRVAAAARQSERFAWKTRYHHARLAAAPAFDADHPDDLSYRPFSVLPLMTETPVTRGTMPAGLIHPLQRQARLLLTAPERLPDTRFTSNPGDDRPSIVDRFTGAAIQQLAVAEPVADDIGPRIEIPNRKPQRLLRTASR